MAIRKTGSATGHVTEVENTISIGLPNVGLLAREHMNQHQASRQDPTWTPDDERELAAEDDDAPVQS